jgi:hypothetical protein
MKNKKTSLLLTLAIFILFFVSANTARSQSTNQKQPTHLTQTEFTGKGPSQETNYYFSFTAGPGEFSVTLQIKATDYSTFARLEVLTTGLNALAMHNMNATTGTGPQEVTKKIVLKKQQTIILKTTLDHNLNEYKITLGGAVKVNAPSDDNSSDASQGNVSGQMQQQGSSAQSAGIINYGQVMNVPKSGSMVIKMNDGTTQKFDLKKVKSVTVTKQ